MSDYIFRKKDHDYYAPCHYHVIFKKNPDFPPFGRLIGDPDISTHLPGHAEIEKYNIGNIISSVLFNLNRKHPFLFCRQYCVMPDHVHAFIQVLERTEKHFGYYMNGIKQSIVKKYNSDNEDDLTPNDIFKENYTDKIVLPGRVYKVIIDYISQNPYRLAVVKKYPHFFERRWLFNIDGIDFEGYGNHLLLDNPFKMQVKFYRKKSIEENKLHAETCIDNIESEGVLVSPFYNDFEKDIRKRAEALKGKIIVIQKEPFREKFKPYDHDFQQCKEGKLLLLAPVKDIFPKKITYTVASTLNNIAAKVAKYKNA